ncbi:hypothetical protein [Scytonema sp. PCC 10023]|uniref:hypothetical protein n=1 Tax=Scytonema sp. PCC 10023 TaxID=1680591 RepID=UPI0039C5BAA0
MRIKIKKVLKEIWEKDERVSLTFIQKLVKRYRISGTVEPKAHGGANTAKLNNE